MKSFVGIDLGTTFSAVATIDETGRPVIVRNPEGQNITPSCVTIDDKIVVVGDFASDTWGNSPEHGAARFKREMGTSATQSINGQEFTPTELSTFVLQKLVQDAENSIGAIGEAVVTIPANFSNEARSATMEAAKAAGLTVNYIINEPTAAALYYAYTNGEDLSGNYAVYDLGGGTFDISIIRVSGHDIEVLATNGVSKLGGDDFDDAIVELVAKKYIELAGEEMDLEDYSKNDAEKEKKSLSKRDKVLAKVARKNIPITREEFEEAISSRITQAELLCESTLDEAGLRNSDIRSVLLAGGSTRIPLVRESINRVFGQEPITSANVDEVVALGAALYAAYKGDQSNLSPAQRSSVGSIKVTESTSKCFGTLSLNLESVQEQPELINNVLIHKGTQIPCSVTESFFTLSDNQTSVNCKLTESTSAETDPRFVNIIWEGELELPEGRAGGQEIQVSFAYDENQIMKCSFVDVATGRKKEVDINLAVSGDIDSSEIDKFIVE